MSHAAWIEREMVDAGVEADLLLEPMALVLGPAVAAAAAWIAARDPGGVAVIVASDHHIPDDGAFLAAVATAGEAAARGWIVTLGVRPSGPATAYGYIRPGETLAEAPPVRRTDGFVEKPDAEAAAGYVKAGYLWNSGNFIAEARVLLEELDLHAPAVSAAARTAVVAAEPSGKGWRLGAAFAGAPKISLDYAVMERTARTAVLPVDFAWSDLGAWDAVWAASPHDEAGNAGDANALFRGSTDCLARSTGGQQVVLIGVERLAVIADDRSVLVCALDSSQAVKAAAEAADAMRPATKAIGLREWASRYGLWFRTAALPTWWALGGDHVQGGFHDALGLDGSAAVGPKRARVQARQAFVYARAARMGLPGPWLQAAEHGFAFFEKHYRRPDGLYRTLVAPTGAPLDETAYLYDQAFALMTLAALHEAAPAGGDRQTMALNLLAETQRHFRHPGGSYREAGPQGFQANPLMHLLEAALAWIEAGGGQVWRDLAEELVALALNRFIDPDGGFLRDYFQADWTPAQGALGGLVDIGHQFEWAWLMDRWAHMAQADEAGSAAHRLYRAGRAGWDADRRAAVDELNDNLTIRSPRARLWPQAEALKAAILLGRGRPEADGYARHAEDAAAGLWRYLETPVSGLWRDKLGPDDRFLLEPAPASTFYHLFGAILALQRYHIAS